YTLRQNLMAAAGTSPEEAARQYRMGKQLNLPPQVLAANPRLLKQQEAVDGVDFDALVRIDPVTGKYPVLARYYSDPINARISHDDKNTLMDLVDGIGKFTARLAASAAAAIPVFGFNLGAFNLELTLAPLKALHLLPDSIVKQVEEQVDQFRDIASGTMNLIDDNLKIGTSEFAQGAETASISLGQNLPWLVAAGPVVLARLTTTMGRSGITAINPATIKQFIATSSGKAALEEAIKGVGKTTVLGMSMPVGLSGITQARQSGLGLPEAALYGMEQFGSEYVFELIPGTSLVRGIAKGTPLGKLAGEVLGKELVTELPTTVVQNFFTWLHIERNKGKTFDDYLQQLPADLRITTYATLIQGPLAAGASRGIAKVSQRFEERRVAKEMVGELERVANLVSQSLTQARDPERLYNLLHTASAGTMVFFDAEPLQQAFAQSGLEPASVLPSVAGQRTDTQGHGIEIPAAELVTAMAQHPQLRESLLNHVRTQPGQATLHELERDGPQASDQLQQEAAKVQEKQKENELFLSESKELRADLQAQLDSVGRFDSSENTSYADLAGAWYDVTADKLGITPKQLRDGWTDSQGVKRAGFNLRVAGGEQLAADGFYQPVNPGIDLEQTMAPVQVEPRFAGMNYHDAQKQFNNPEFRQQLVGEVENKNTGWKIDISGKNIRHAAMRTITANRAVVERLEAVAAWPELMRSAILVESREALKSTEAHKKIHRFYVPFKLGNEVFAVKMTAKEYEPGIITPEEIDVRKLYDTDIAKKMSAGTSKDLYTRSVDRPELNPKPTADNYTLRDILTGLQDDFGNPYLNQSSSSPEEGVSASRDQSFNTQAQGTFDPSNLEIRLLANADRTTFLHETSHFFLHATMELAAMEGAPQGIVDDMTALMKQFGVADITTWRGMNTDEQRPHHEQFARSFEQYLQEGKAPSEALKPLFRRFSGWLKQVYRSIQEFVAAHPNEARLNPELSAIFDRLLATDEQIRATKANDSSSAVIDPAGAVGMTPEEFHRYPPGGAVDPTTSPPPTPIAPATQPTPSPPDGVVVSGPTAPTSTPATLAQNPTPKSNTNEQQPGKTRTTSSFPPVFSTKGVSAKTMQDGSHYFNRDRDWEAAKELGDFAAAQRFTNRHWNQELTDKLKNMLTDPSNTVFLSQPSSSGLNMLARALAEKLANQLSGKSLYGEMVFKPQHDRQSKSLKPPERLLFPRDYALLDSTHLHAQTRGKKVVVVDDIITSGGSIRQMIVTLQAQGIPVEAVAAFGGNPDMTPQRGSINNLKEALKNANMHFDAWKLAKYLTNNEIKNLTDLILYAQDTLHPRFAYSRQTIARELQRLFP
ncbi:MAG: hypothetical protein HQL56_18565, partial [Magnetococcales bacterium]|nr:hypothetical protein [Magnetococcales bacterium]